MFSLINQLPKLIVDCGANCGHFSILVEICIKYKFSSSNAEYLLIEANPDLIDICAKNLKDTKIFHRSKIFNSLLGQKSGIGKFWINKKNYLSSSIEKGKSEYYININYLDLNTLVKDEIVDILKIDIEGAEIPFLEGYSNILENTRIILLELHNVSKIYYVEKLLNDVGFNLIYKILVNDNYLIIMQNRNRLDK